MSSSLDSNRVAVVTGASRGIGLAVSRRLASDGWRVTMAARGEDDLNEAAASIREQFGTAVLPIPTDFRDSVAIENCFRKTAEQWGRIDGLVNNAGASKFGDFFGLEYDDWHDTYRLKLLGYVHAARIAAEQMMQASSGAIVNIAGNGGRQVSNTHMIGGSANAAVIHFTRSLATRVGPFGVRVNSVSPGPILTERMLNRLGQLAEEAGTTIAEEESKLSEEIPLRRLGRPADVASLVEFLLSDDSSFINGEDILIDGGQVTAV